MDHRPFEDWLLNDESLTSDQDRDLRSHLRTCPECSALARANLSLRSAAAQPPEVGFTDRFKVRLEARRRVQRWHTLIGLSLLALVGGSAALYFFFPYLPYLLLPPDRLLSLWIGNMVNFALVTRALQVVGGTIYDVAVSIVPSYIWGLLLLLVSVVGFLLAAGLRFIGRKVRSLA